MDADCVDTDLDVMSGYPGAIPVLLELSQQYARPEWADLASRWGDRLRHAAMKSPEGWSWKTTPFPDHTEGAT